MGQATADTLFAHSCRSDSRKGVCRSRGGESCAFDGAMIVLQCIADAAHLVHGPIACGGNSWETRGTVSDRGLLHRRAYTTDLGELEIIYGAEGKLFDAIRDTVAHACPAAVFVYTTCVSGLIGEDLQAVCGKAESELGLPVIPVPAPGFTGPKNLGNRIAGEVLLDRVIGTGGAPETSLTDVNLIGEYNIAGDLFAVEPLFQRAGIRLLARITGNGTFEEISRAHHAKANAVVCSRALINVAREMERRYAIPFAEISFFGSTQTSRALRSIARLLAPHAPELPGRVEEVIREEEALLRERLDAFAHLRGKKAVLYSGGVKSWALISALKDLGVDVVAVGTKKSTAEDEEKIRALLGDDAPLHEDTTAGNLLRLYRDRGAHMLIAGGRNRYLAAKEGLPFVDVNQERHHPYAGYAGLVNLARQISCALSLENGAGTRWIAPVVRDEERPVTIDPLKHSPALGAAMALQGIHRATALVHGAQGCTFLGKVLLTRHFREPIAMAGSKLFTEDVVMGSGERLVSALTGSIEKNRPDLLGLLSTGLTEVKGEDIRGAASRIAPGATRLITVSTPDYSGGLEQGFAAVVEEVLRFAEGGTPRRNAVNILAGPSLTPGDVTELRDAVERFGLSPTVLPDLSALDGSRTSFSPLAEGGTRVRDIRAMGSASLTICLGRSVYGAARILEERCGVPWVGLHSVTGLVNTERFLGILSEHSGRPIPKRFDRERRILADTLRDVVDITGGARIAIAGDTDAALAICSVVREVQAEPSLAVVPVRVPGNRDIPAREVVVGDFASIHGNHDLLIANSHGRLAAAERGISHMEWGFPSMERYGHTASSWTLYRGTLNFVHTIANCLKEAHR